MSIALQRIRELLTDDRGDDLVEYALLGGFIAFAGVAGLNALQTGLGGVFTGSQNNVNNLWVTPNPAGGSGS
jgi:Flp pilus assembly pilin Flp